LTITCILNIRSRGKNRSPTHVPAGPYIPDILQ
jgi:hypothetical protein